MVLTCICLMIGDDECHFVCSLAIFGDLFTSFAIFLLGFILIVGFYAFFICSGYKSLSDSMSSNIFPPFYVGCLFFFMNYVFEVHKFSILVKSDLSVFLLLSVGLLSK